MLWLLIKRATFHSGSSDRATGARRKAAPGLVWTYAVVLAVKLALLLAGDTYARCKAGISTTRAILHCIKAPSLAKKISTRRRKNLREQNDSKMHGHEASIKRDPKSLIFAGR